MSDLITQFQEQLQGDIAALEAAQEILNRVPEAKESIRQVAHRLRQASAMYALPVLSQVLRPWTALEETERDDLVTHLDQQLALLRGVLVSTPTFTEKKEILLVGEQVASSPGVRAVLQKMPVSVHFATTAAEAERAINKHDFALIALPLLLPDADGRLLLLYLRERHTLDGTTIFMVASSTSEMLQSECIALGADHYFEEPLAQGLFAEALFNALRGPAEENGRKRRREPRKDPVTGLLHRGAFTRAFERAHGLASSNRFPLSFIRISLDRIEAIHEQDPALKDEILKQVAGQVANFLQKSGSRVRWDYNEIAVLLLNMDVERTIRNLKRVQQSLENEQFMGQDWKSFKATFSAAVVDVPADSSLQDTIARTDRLLCLARETSPGQIMTEAEIPVLPEQVILLSASPYAPDSHQVEHLLREQGFVVKAFEGDFASVVNGQHKAPALAIVDLSLPNEQGFGLIEELAHQKNFGSMPILILAEMGTDSDIARGFTLGADDFLLKPFTKDQLLTHVHRLLRLRHLAGHPASRNGSEPVVVDPPEVVDPLEMEPTSFDGLPNSEIEVEPAASVAPAAIDHTYKAQPIAPQPVRVSENAEPILMDEFTTGDVPLQQEMPEEEHGQQAAPHVASTLNAFAEIVRAKLAQGQSVEVPGLGEFRIQHQGSRVENRDNGQVVVHPPKNLVDFVPYATETAT